MKKRKMENNSSSAVKQQAMDEMKTIHAFISPSVKDAWFALLKHSFGNRNVSNSTNRVVDGNNRIDGEEDLFGGGSLNRNDATGTHTFLIPNDVLVEHPELEYPLPKGQVTKATKIHALSTSLKRAADIAAQLTNMNGSTAITTTTNDTTASSITNHKSHETEEKEDSHGNEIQSQIEMIQTIQSEHHHSKHSMSSTTTTHHSPKWIMEAFQKRIRSIRDYHARHNVQIPSSSSAHSNNHLLQESLLNYSLEEMTMLKERERYNPTTGITSRPTTTTTSSLQTMVNQQEKRKKRRLANPIADGYDLYSIMNEELNSIRKGDVFSIEEVMGRYLDLIEIHDSVLSVPSLNDMFVCGMSLSSSTTKKKGYEIGEEEQEEKSDDKEDQLNTTSNSSQQQRQENISYPDFCTLLQKGIATSIPETKKLSSTIHKGTRKKYIRFLTSLQSYLISFLSKVSPLLDISKEVIHPAMEQFDKEWWETGGVLGWECKASERTMANPPAGTVSRKENMNKNDQNHDTKQTNEDEELKGIDLKQYKDVQELVSNQSAETLKSELSRLGMKCGGTPLDRAKRLWCTRDKPLSELPTKLFVKKGNSNFMNKKVTATGDSNSRMRKVEKVEVAVEEGKNHNTSSASNNHNALVVCRSQRRVDIARLEVVVTALLDQLRPMLDATARRAERRLTQTINEKEREMEEELSGAYTSVEDEVDVVSKSEKKKDGENGDDETDSEDEDTPVYNPKGVPLGWDGKPISYWLYKLHGLNQFFVCEICGNVFYCGSQTLKLLVSFFCLEKKKTNKHEKSIEILLNQ